MGCCISSDAITEPLPLSKNGIRKLFVIVAHFNPQRFKVRARLLNEFMKRIIKCQEFYDEAGPGAKLNLQVIPVVVELTFDGAKSEFQVPRNFKGRVVLRDVVKSNLMWSKEQLINLGIREAKIQPDDFVAWIDGDIEFPTHLWAVQAVKRMLEVPNSIMQLFRTCHLLNKYGNVFETVQSFAYQYEKGMKYAPVSNTDTKNYWHPGFAWAAQCSTLQSTGLLLDRTLGSADLHMACALIGEVEQTFPKGEVLPDGYKSLILDWQTHCVEDEIKLICTPYQRAIRHHWHGSMKNRQYMERWKIISENQLDPQTACRFDDNLGLFVWTEDVSTTIVDDICKYFEQRQEDSDLDDSNDSYGHNKHHGNDGPHAQSLHHPSPHHHHHAESDNHYRSEKPSYWSGYA